MDLLTAEQDFKHVSPATGLSTRQLSILFPVFFFLFFSVRSARVIFVMPFNETFEQRYLSLFRTKCFGGIIYKQVDYFTLL